MVVAAGTSDIPPAERTVLALGEAKAGEIIGHGHVHQLEQARAALGFRAAHAKLLLFAPAFTDELRQDAQQRPDIELIDLDRLYYGS